MTKVLYCLALYKRVYFEVNFLPMFGLGVSWVYLLHWGCRGICRRVYFYILLKFGLGVSWVYFLHWGVHMRNMQTSLLFILLKFGLGAWGVHIRNLQTSLLLYFIEVWFGCELSLLSSLGCAYEEYADEFTFYFIEVWFGCLGCAY